MEITRIKEKKSLHTFKDSTHTLVISPYKNSNSEVKDENSRKKLG